jgi:Ca2+-binding RTX toxin-like protein
MSSAGDINGDGFADLIVGATGVGTAGAAYVIYGRDWNGVVDYFGTAGADELTGTAGADAIVGGHGDDTLTGGGGADSFRGGQGHDRIEIADATFFDVDGGTGADTLALVGENLVLDLTAIASSKVTSIEKIDLVAGSGNNSLTLALGDVLDLSDASNTLTIDGDADDSVTVADGTWSAPVLDGDYNVYTLGAATLRIHADITDVTFAP